MSGYLIDTDVLIDFFKKRPYALVIIESHASRHELSVSILTVAELAAGWSQKEATLFLAQLYDLVKRIPISESIAELAGSLRYQYKQKGHTISLPDAIIAATAITNGYTLVTRNIKDYPMPELHLYTFPKNN